MKKGFLNLIYEEMRKYFPIYEEAVRHIGLCNCSILNFLKQYMRKIWFLFLSLRITYTTTGSVLVLLSNFFPVSTESRPMIMYGTVYHVKLCFLSRPSIDLNPEKVRYGFSYYLSFIYPNGERSHPLFTHVDSHLSPLLLEEGGEPFFCCCLISDLITM